MYSEDDKFMCACMELKEFLFQEQQIFIMKNGTKFLKNIFRENTNSQKQNNNRQSTCYIFHQI